MMGATKRDLLAFEQEIAALFNAGKIKSPVHLAGGNEDQIIDAFRDIEPRDYVFGTWRSHYHCLLKGVPRELLKQKIIAGRSINLCFPEYRVLCSAMVGGNAPIALGVAWSIKRNHGPERVHCFMGDMGFETGVVRECVKYANGHNLPIRFIVEDNGKSVGTDTREAWGTHYEHRGDMRYEYHLPHPHVGAGQWVQF